MHGVDATSPVGQFACIREIYFPGCPLLKLCKARVRTLSQTLPCKPRGKMHELHGLLSIPLCSKQGLHTPSGINLTPVILAANDRNDNKEQQQHISYQITEQSRQFWSRQCQWWIQGARGACAPIHPLPALQCAQSEWPFRERKKAANASLILPQRWTQPAGYIAHIWVSTSYSGPVTCTWVDCNCC